MGIFTKNPGYNRKIPLSCVLKAFLYDSFCLKKLKRKPQNIEVILKKRNIYKGMSFPLQAGAFWNSHRETSPRARCFSTHLQPGLRKHVGDSDPGFLRQSSKSVTFSDYAALGENSCMLSTWGCLDTALHPEPLFFLSKKQDLEPWHGNMHDFEEWAV